MDLSQTPELSAKMIVAIAAGDPDPVRAELSKLDERSIEELAAYVDRVRAYVSTERWRRANRATRRVFGP